MDKIFEDFKSMYIKIQQDIVMAMEYNVAPSIKEVESRMVKEHVYDVYKSSSDSFLRYERRKDEGGLSDVRNMSSKVYSNWGEVSLEITNDTEVNEFFYYKYHPRLDELIEYGKTYPLFTIHDEEEYPFYKPRPFTEKTIEYVEQTNLVVNELEKKLGYISEK